MLAVILLVLVLVMFYVDFLHIINNIAKILRIINYMAKFLTVQNIFRWLWPLRSHSEEGEGPRPENIAR